MVDHGQHHVRNWRFGWSTNGLRGGRDCDGEPGRADATEATATATATAITPDPATSASEDEASHRW